MRCRDCESTTFYVRFRYWLLGPGTWVVVCGNNHQWIPSDEVIIELTGAPF